MAMDDYRRPRNTKQQGGVIRHVAGLLTSFLLGYLVASVFDLATVITWVNQNWLNVQPTDGRQQAIAVAKKADLPKPKFEFYTLLSKDNNAPSDVHHFAESPTANQLALAAPESTASVSQSHPENAAQVNVTEPLATTSEGTARPDQSIIEHPVVDEHPASDAPAGSALNAQKPPVSIEESKPVNTAGTTTPSARPAGRETYMIQVAAVTRRQDAERLKVSLSQKGYSVMIVSPATPNVNWFRVVIGPFHSRSDAEKAQQMVARNEHLQGMIRKVDV